MSNKIETPDFGPLSGVRVVVSAMEIAGPFPAHLMAEWGAEVIWLENTAYPDTIRVQRNYRELARRNFHTMTINVFSEEGREAFLKLLETTDILIESSKGPSWARHGITDELMWGANPALVIAHLSGYGHWGDPAYVNLPSYDLIAQAFSGYLVQNGEVDQPVPAFPYAGDYFAGFTVLSSALAALYRAKQTGKGESIDVSMYEALLRVGQYYMMDYFNEGKVYPRSTKGKDPLCVGCGIYKCTDGYMCVELVGVKQVAGMLGEIGMGELIGTESCPEGCQLLLLSMPRGEEIEARLDEYFSTMTLEEAEAVMGRLKIAGGRMMTVDQLEKHPHYIAREDIVTWKGSEGRTVKGPNVMPRFKNRPGRIWRGMPARGEDTRSILSELGYSEAEVDALEAKGVVMTEH